MSSSAFTPSTTTVTNNVPVNVPVVEAWQSYTPTFGNFGTVTGISAWYRRVGDSIQIKARYVTGTTVASAVTISLPSALNTDASKSGSLSMIVGKWYRDIATSANRKSGVMIMRATSSNVLAFGSDDYNSGVAPLTELNGTAIAGSGETHVCEFTVPIAEWAGSGTTTLATRAVEEYVSHDGTSIVRGAAGSLVPNVAASINTTSYTVDFSQSSQSTDAVILEYSRNNLGWQNAADFAPFFGGNNSSATNLYGVRIYKSSATQYVVEFGNQGTRVQASNISAGATSWADERIAGTRFRLRKVSSGAQVGYPVSARNIVGDTSGTVVPTGMIGETKTISQPSNTNFPASDVFGDIGSFQLTPGIWLLSASMSYSMDNDVTNFSYGTFGFSTTSGNSYPDQLLDMSNFNYIPKGFGRTVDNFVVMGLSVPCFYVNISALTTYYLKISPGTFSGTVPQYKASARAVRIA